MKLKYRHRTPLDQKAFTIIELMIATAVLSTILLLVTVMMISIGNLYYKGVNQIRVQDNVRNITDEISQQLQLNNSSVLYSASGDPNAIPQAYCIGTTRYNFILGEQLSDNTGPYLSAHVLWRDTVPGDSCTAMTTAMFDSPNLGSTDPTGTELMTPNARLTQFSINPPPATLVSPFTITVGEAYGANTLLCDPGTAGDCDNANSDSTHVWDPTIPTNPAVLCKGTDGNQLCSVSSLKTTVVQRISGS